MDISAGILRILFCNIFCMVFVTLQTTSASIVYSGVKDIQLDEHVRGVAIDLDGGGIVDFLFEYNTESERGLFPWPPEASFREFTIDGELGGDNDSYFAAQRVDVHNGIIVYLPPSRFNAGHEIGIPDDRKQSLWVSSRNDGLLAGHYGTWWGGQFVGSLEYEHGVYIGVKFYHQENWLYGWIEFESDHEVTQGLITGWAYEDVPGQSIPAGAIPEPATFILLGLGGLSLLRRRQTL